MPETTAHPSQAQLSAYNLGQLPPDEAVAIETHISKCEPCCDTIISLSSDDTFVGILKEARHLPADQTVDHGVAPVFSSDQDVPTQLAEHPRYEILSLIGKGGMGDVYKARHRKMERTVALKVINRRLVRKVEAIQRFHREVKAAAQLSHPNIVTAYDADQADDFHFMVMEYVDGVDLSQTVKLRGALPVAEACDYIRQAAIGLQHAHERGMVHRDIKPHNLMVTKDGTVKILDFGLASLAPEAIADADTVEACGDLTAAGAIMGTPDFISPEQADDARTADIRSDIYSLGATLYFLLSAKPPFADGSVMHKLKSHAQSDPEPLSTVRLDVPADLAVVITRMMGKDPDVRFQTPEELAEALKPFSQSAEPRQIVEPSTQAKPRRWKPTFLSLTAVAVLFVATVFAGLIYYIQTDYGVVRVEVTDPSLQVSINDETITMNDKDGKRLTIRPGEQTLIIRKGDANFEFETDRFQIRRQDEIAFKVELLEGEVVVRKDGERFHSKALSDDIDVRQILDQMEKAYAECKSYRDSGVIKSVFFRNTNAPETTVEHSFTTAFVRPDRFRLEIKTEDNRLLISANEKNVQTWWDVESGVKKPESLEFALAQANGFIGGDAGRIPALLMPQEFEISGGLDLIDPKRIEDGKLQNVECFRLEYNFRDEQFKLWIDKQSYLVRRMDERIKVDGIRIERTTTYDPTIDGKITDEMLEFDPPSPRVAEVKPTKRPTTFDSPTGSNIMLMEVRRMAVNEFKTVSRLMRQANQLGPDSQLAIIELLRREDDSLLDNDQVNDLIDLVLKYQADRERPWRTEMGDLIEKHWVAGTLDRDIWEKYTAQFLVDICELEVRPRIAISSPGGVLVQRNIRDLRCGSGKYIEFLLRETNGVIRVSSTIVGRFDLAGTTQIGHDNSGMYSANSSPLTEQQWEAIEPGKHIITFDVELAILESVGPEAMEALDAFASRKVTFETETVFLPAGQSTVNVNVDPAMKAQVDRAVSIKRVETGPMSMPTTNEKYVARVVLAFQSRPIDNVFTIVLKDGDDEYKAGSEAHVIKAEDENGLISMASIAADLSGKRIDVILRPNPDAAENSIDLFEIWGKEVVFQDVLVH